MVGLVEYSTVYFRIAQQSAMFLPWLAVESVILPKIKVFSLILGFTEFRQSAIWSEINPLDRMT